MFSGAQPLNTNHIVRYPNVIISRIVCKSTAIFAEKCEEQKAAFIFSAKILAHLILCSRRLH